MRTVGNQLNACLELTKPLAPLEVLLGESVGCVMAQDVVSATMRPVVDIAAGAGYALRSEDVMTAGRIEDVVLKVVDQLTPEDSRVVTLEEGNAIRVFAGSPIPINADAVVLLDDAQAIGLRERNDVDDLPEKVVIKQHVPPGTNILAKGSDIAHDTTVLTAGTRINARHIALLAAIGRERVRVRPKPRVVIVSIGDELIEPGTAPAPGKIYDANSAALSMAVADAGGDTFQVPAIPNDPKKIREAVDDQLIRADLVITTGGISVEINSQIFEALSALGEVTFSEVAMSPAKRIGFGTVGENVPIFCLPGDPVEAQIAYEIFVRPALRTMAGWKDLYRPSLLAEVDKAWVSPKGLREFVRVRLVGNPKGGYQARVQGHPQDRGLLSMSRSNALAVIPEDITEVKVGDKFHCMMLD